MKKYALITLSSKHLRIICESYHFTIKNCMVKETKKRVVSALHFDMSWKEEKRLHQWQGNIIFKGLATEAKYFGKVLDKFDIVLDSHEKIKALLAARKIICSSFRHKLPKLAFTNDPFRDRTSLMIHFLT